MNRRSGASNDAAQAPPAATRPADQLRERAEARIIAALRTDPVDANTADLQRLIHELSVHQAELELQNEELRQSQDALEHSRHRYIDLYENAPVGFLTCRLNGLIVDCNRTAARMLGASADKVRDRRLVDAVVLEDRMRLSEHFGKLLTRTTMQSCEVRLVRFGQPPLWVQLHMMLDEGETNTSTTCRVALTDISERMDVQQRVLRLAAIVDSSDDAIVSRDLDGLVISWNAGAERLLGYRQDEMLGRTLDALVPAEHGETPVRRLLRQAQAVPHFDSELAAKDGSVVPVSVLFSLIRDAGGRVFGTAMIARDISRRMKAEQTLRRRLRQLDLLSRTGQALIMSDDLTPASIADVFRRAANAVGAEICVHFHPDATPGTFMLASSMGLPEELAARIARLADGALCGMVAARREPIVIEGLAGSDVPGAEAWHAAGARCYAGYPLLASGLLLGVVAFATTARDRFVEGDLQVIQTVCDQVAATIERSRLFNEIQQSEQALKEADRKKDHFIATLAHELRNPLAPINNAVMLLRRIGNPTPSEAAVLETMTRQVNHMVRLVDDLLEVSRITLGKVVLRTERVELMSVVRSAIDISRPLIDAGSHRLQIESPPNPLHVEADAVRLAQVFANLLNNSAKYTEKGGTISLSIQREGDEAVIAVRDTGAGISPELLPHVFELFMQGSSSRYAQSGLGIGLTLVRSLVEMHGGRVAASSAGTGKGSQFVVRLPLLPALTDEQHAAADQPIELSSHCRVLLVDDNRDAANSLAGLLQVLGATVDTHYDGFAVARALETFNPNVVILDIGMPGMDGYEVARSIRDDPRYSDILLIALTGWGTSEDQRRSRRAGFDHHLVKPADIGLLQRLLHEAALTHHDDGGTKIRTATIGKAS